MFFSNVISTLSSVVDWLERGTDAYTWDDAGDLTTDAMNDAQQMAQPQRRRDKGFENRPPQPSPVADEIRRAWPHLQALRVALQVHDRDAAINHGRKAVAALEGRPGEL